MGKGTIPHNRNVCFPIIAINNKDPPRHQIFKINLDDYIDEVKYGNGKSKIYIDNKNQIWKEEDQETKMEFLLKKMKLEWNTKINVDGYYYVCFEDPKDKRQIYFKIKISAKSLEEISKIPKLKF